MNIPQGTEARLFFKEAKISIRSLQGDDFPDHLVFGFDYPGIFGIGGETRQRVHRLTESHISAPGIAVAEGLQEVLVEVRCQQIVVHGNLYTPSDFAAGLYLSKINRLKDPRRMRIHTRNNSRRASQP
ncbi:MAG: hypothetical protein BWY09_00370 [Candidatus Hydrogenedentes bacterium ADurb.Bin179]|nr:MAG: hypothetical protein BWY09_00370 [Candidatus Hydrogenedentes bacterium ADurb.Bin179]